MKTDQNNINLMKIYRYFWKKCNNYTYENQQKRPQRLINMVEIAKTKKTAILIKKITYAKILQSVINLVQNTKTCTYHKMSW